MDKFTNTFVTTSRDSSNIFKLFVSNILGHSFKLTNKVVNSLFHSADNLNGVDPGHNNLHTLSNHSSGKDGGSGGTITSQVVGLGSSLANKLGTNVLNGILKLDLSGDSNTIIDDLGGAVFRFEDDITSLGAKRDTDDGSELVNTSLHFLKRIAIGVEMELLGGIGAEGSAANAGRASAGS